MYENFKKLDGTHPLRDVSSNGYVDYQVTYRPNGSLVYFNYVLAKELKLIPQRHRVFIYPELEKIILRTFSLQIVNEYDEQHKTKIFKQRIKNRKYMATRYVQLQHKSRTGKTSGDGRSIWNGCIVANKIMYDISSCGTGATMLSPGAQLTDISIKTGDNTLGYANGLAGLDEALISATMTEILYQRGIPTERVLAVIAYKNNTAVIIRATPNLLRPAHIFRYLKSENKKDLMFFINYFIDRQIHNGDLKLTKKDNKHRYNTFLKYLIKQYAMFAAILEREYIFSWFAWDGDNMLAFAGLLDYGSIRQFAARHDKYRFDDQDRLSTTLSEQSHWCRKTVQYFVQAVDYISLGKKTPVETFDNHWALDEFDNCFISESQKHFLWQIGFSSDNIDFILKNNKLLVENFQHLFSYFEKIKTIKGEIKVADGVDHRPVFILRNILRELPKKLIENWHDENKKFIQPEKFCEIMAGSYVNRKDLVLSDNRIHQVLQFQKAYIDLINACNDEPMNTLININNNASVINYEYRFTGDGILYIVEQMIKAKKKLSKNKFQKLMDRFIASQVLMPGKWQPIKKSELYNKNKLSYYFRNIQKILEDHKELI